MAKVPGARVVTDRLTQSQRKANPDGRMPLMEHIRELRNRIVKAALAMAVGMVVGLVWFTPIWNYITAPYCHAIGGKCNPKIIGDALTYTGPLDGFYLHIK